MKSKIQEEREDEQRQIDLIRRAVGPQLDELTEAVRRLTFAVNGAFSGFDEEE